MPDQPITTADTRPTQSAWLAELKQIVTELDSESDRAAAIVGVALLDEKLRQAFEALFDPKLSRRARAELFEGPAAPLGTYSSRIRITRALSFFGDDFEEDLKLLGRIRNRFAHDLAVKSFDEPGIAGLCQQLRGYKMERIDPDGTRTPLMQWKSAKDARSAFVATVQVAVYLLMIFLDSKGLFRMEA